MCDIIIIVGGENMDNDFELLLLKNQLCFPTYAAANKITRRYGPLLKELNLTYTQYIVMMVMWEHKKINEKKLVELLYLQSNTLAPLLKKLEQKGFIELEHGKSDKRTLEISITKEGEKELHKLIKCELSKNPLQFISNAKIKLSVADILPSEEKKELFLHLKTLAMEYKQTAENILNDEYTDKNFYQRILLDNSSVEYSNLITVIEGFEKDNERNSQ